MIKWVIVMMLMLIGISAAIISLLILKWIAWPLISLFVTMALIAVCV